MAIKRTEHKLVITVDNIKPADAIGLIKMFKHICAFFADGDGAFHPKVSFDYPIELPEVPEITGVKEDNSFRIDSDSIAWEIYHDKDEK